ncbi:hypothetical protein [Ruegeria atlantica]|uniref:hypothetical protein n=1 Tax=Ruegeria atlantica TaxID=81569 RepID=UPI0014808AEA|nr:hypothetical protein [Ruegeria atlantica]
MPWDFQPELIIQGVASKADLLTRPTGDIRLDRFLIVNDPAQIDASWIGESFDEVVKTMHPATSVKIDGEDQPTHDLHAGGLFFRNFQMVNSKFRSINLSSTSLGGNNYLNNVDTGVVNLSFTHALPDGDTQPVKGFVFQDTTCSSMLIARCTLKHISFRDFVTSGNLVIEQCDTEHIFLTQNTRVSGLRYHGTSATLSADFDRVAIKPQPNVLEVPLGMYPAIEQLQVNW